VKTREKKKKETQGNNYIPLFEEYTTIYNKFRRNIILIWRLLGKKFPFLEKIGSRFLTKSHED